MKTVEQLRTRILELGKQAAQFSQQAVEISKTNREQSKNLTGWQAKEASKRCQLLIQELKRQ
ncbi:hypothetical protein GNF10_32220 [Nostoc sp. UCD121]|uniref:hypothetical protein n=1 Tax=unclassified Nostoc TaxID=2593658 RepID=UPI001625A2CB|nr:MULTISPECIES: hypothetical protein [unclassified Nostoc]MBC1220725.1 hypothetical protein [Nostoc sp. UCD120]MBC1280482.1 hypothetical protein [Nostoc sp. UCD121]MBC1298685.1 hypothetical protein [Nostoc sp. UCD122]